MRTAEAISYNDSNAKKRLGIALTTYRDLSTQTILQ